MACQTNDPFADAATAEEKACIRPLLEKIRDERFELGTGKVDLRLRQLLIPKENAPGGYVAVTPITSGSVAISCSITRTVSFWNITGKHPTPQRPKKRPHFPLSGRLAWGLAEPTRKMWVV